MPILEDPLFLRESSLEDHIDPHAEAVEYIPELDLDLSDEDLADFIDKKISIAKSHFETENNLYERQKRNIEYYLGKQIDYEMFEDWQVPYINNIIFRNIETLLPIALSRIPDVVAIPANENPESKKFADNIKKVLEKKLKSKEWRTVFKKALLHNLLSFYGVIKYRWDKNIGKSGDIIIENVLPENIVFDHTAATVEEMDFIAERVERTVRELVTEYPKKKAKILEVLGLEEQNEKQMQSKVKLWEVQFTIVDKQGKTIEALAIKYRHEIFHKQKHQNWDYEGVNFADSPSQGDDILRPETSNTYYNHFEKPKKSYVIINYHNLGRTVVDETNAIEQSISLQDNTNKRGRQVTELADKANGKWAISAIAMSEDNAALISDSPDEALYIENPQNLPLNSLIQRFPGLPPAPILYQDQQFNKQSIDDMFGTHGSTRGEKETDVATTTLALQQQDVTRIQDMTQETIDKAANELVNAHLQLIKVFATEEYMTRILGSDGDTTFIRLTRDMIEDGLEVHIKSSLTDRQERRQLAQNEASLGFTEPLSYYEDMDHSNPKQRAKRLVMWNQQNYEEYLDESVAEQARAIRDLFLISQGQFPQDQPSLSKGYFEGVKQFVASPQFQRMSDQEKQPIIQYIQLLAQQEQKGGQQQPQQQAGQQQRPQLQQPQKQLQKPSPSMFARGRELQQRQGGQSANRF